MLLDFANKNPDRLSGLEITNVDGDDGDVTFADTIGTKPDSTDETVSGTLGFSNPDCSVAVTSVDFEGNTLAVPQDGTITTRI